MEPRGRNQAGKSPVRFGEIRMALKVTATGMRGAFGKSVGSRKRGVEQW